MLMISFILLCHFRSQIVEEFLLFKPLMVNMLHLFLFVIFFKLSFICSPYTSSFKHAFFLAFSSSSRRKLYLWIVGWYVWGFYNFVSMYLLSEALLWMAPSYYLIRLVIEGNRDEMSKQICGGRWRLVDTWDLTTEVFFLNTALAFSSPSVVLFLRITSITESNRI